SHAASAKVSSILPTHPSGFEAEAFVEIEWTDTDPDTGERRFVCARKFARSWQFVVRFKRRTNWQPAPDVTREMWGTLLDALERRYQRREGVDDRDLADVRKVIAGLRPPPNSGGENISPQRHQDRTKDHEEEA